MSHPNLGAPPRDETAGFPADGDRLMRDRTRIGRRSLEIVLDQDPTVRDRLGEEGLARLLRDTEVHVERLARSVSADDPYFLREFAEWVAPLYRRRLVPMDDLIALSRAVAEAAASAMSAAARPSAERATEAAVVVYRRHRRLAGDARRRNPILAAIYKGA